MGIYDDKRKMTHTPDGYELMNHISGDATYDFKWHCGPYISKFLTELRDNKRFMATKCPGCGTVYIPPRQVCGSCFKEMDEWVEVGPEGELHGYTIVRFPYIDPNNGQLKEVPYTAIWIELDGADTRFLHFCNEPDEENMEVGMRMRPVFAEERTGTVHDVEYFEIIKD